MGNDRIGSGIVSNNGDIRLLNSRVETSGIYGILAGSFYIGDSVKKEPPVEWHKHTISYHPNFGMGDVPLDMNRYYKGSKVELLQPGEDLRRAGFTFGGWELVDGTPATEPFRMGDVDVTLFATWVAD